MEDKAIRRLAIAALMQMREAAEREKKEAS